MSQDMFQLLMCPLKPLSVIWQGNVTVTALWSSIFSLAKKGRCSRTRYVLWPGWFCLHRCSYGGQQWLCVCAEANESDLIRRQGLSAHILASLLCSCPDALDCKTESATIHGLPVFHLHVMLTNAHRDSYISSIESSDIFYKCHWLAWVYFYNQSSCVWVRAAHLLLYSNNLVHYTTCLHVCISGKFLEWSHLHHSEASISLPACLVDGKSITAAFTDQTLLEYASDFIPSPL